MATWRTILPGMPEMSLEWSPTTAPDETPVWQSLSDRILEAHLRAYRQTELDQFETGELTAVLANADRALEPLGNSGKNVPRIRVRYQLRDEDGEEYDRFGGFLRAITVSWADPPFSTVTFRASDYGLLLQQTEVRVDGYPLELGHVRMGRVLDAMGVPAGDRDLDAADTTCRAIPAVGEGENPVMQSALQHLQDAARSDGGYLFVDVTGKIRFHNRRKRMDEFGGIHLTFGDDDDSVEVVDEFDGSALDTSLWTLTQDSDTSVTVSGGSLRFANDGDAGQSIVALNETIDLTDGGAFVAHVPTIDSQPTNQRFVLMLPDNGDTNNRIEILAIGTGASSLQARQAVAGSLTTVATMNVSGIEYLRIRAHAGDIFYEASADGVSWSVIAKTAAPITITALQPRLVSGPTIAATAHTNTVSWAVMEQGECPYQPDLTGETNDATLWTSWTVKTADGHAETHDATPAVSGYKAARDEFQSLLAYPGEAYALASLSPWRYNRAIWRFPAIRPMIGNDRMTKAMLRQILKADVGCRFRLIRRPPEESTTDPVDEQLHLEGIAEDAVIGQLYSIQFAVSPADPDIDEWILGTSELGVDTFIGI